MFVKEFLITTTTCALATAGVPSFGSPATELGPQATLAARVIRAIKGDEAAVQAIRFEANAKLTTWNPAAHAMVPSEDCSLRALYTPGGRYLIDVKRLLTTAINGPAPVSYMSFVIAYDGRIGTVYTRRSGAIGSRPQAVSTGTISGHSPRWASSLGISSGWQFTVWGIAARLLHKPSTEPLSALLSDPPPGGKIVFRETTDRQGRTFVDVTFGYIDQQVMRMDPRKGMAIVRDETFVATPILRGQKFIAKPITLRDGKVSKKWQWAAEPTQVVRIIGFWNPKRSVYLPKRIISQTFLPRVRAVGPANRLVVSVTDARPSAGINPIGNPFVVRFPAGAIITDQSTGQVVRVGGTPQQQMEVIEKAVAAARREVATQPARQRGNK